MNKYEQRDIDAKKGYCCGNAWSWLKLALSDKEIKKKIKNMEIGLNDVDGVKNDLKQEVSRKFCDTSSVQMKFLSMGMSHDYEIALEEGSNMVRIGQAIFS